MGCTFFSVKFDDAFAGFVISCLQPDGAIIQYTYILTEIARPNCAL